MNIESKRLAINGTIVFGVLMLGALIFFGFLKVFEVLADLPIP